MFFTGPAVVLLDLSPPGYNNLLTKYNSTNSVQELGKVRCIKSGRNALLRFKQSLTDPSDRLASWVGKECCIWKGVYSDAGYNVIGLDLNGRTNNCYWKKVGYLIPGNSTCFGGNISLDLLDLYHLEYLDLGGNDFLYPFDIVERSSIKDLNWVSGLSSLKYLDLSYNKFVNSELPKWLSNATTIETLYMVYSNIQGPISNVEWGKLCNLQKLYLGKNKLNGDISRVVEGLSNCSNPTIELSRLEILYLGENQLKGALPESIFNFSELTELRLTTNALEGNLSQNHFERLHQLEVLSLSRGISFSVNLSNEWVPPFSLYTIELRSCSLGPKFPTWLKIQKQLQWVILTNGSISKPIPPWLWMIYYYGVVVDLSSNHFHGSLSLWPTVTHLNLANNWFSGYIPLNIGHVMTKLRVLDLSGNAFIGTIPYSITSVKQLLRLDLSDNHLSGKIPDWWYDLQQLQVIDLSGNNLSGTIPPSVCSPLSLFWLRLCRNNLSGGLPKSLRNCNSLRALDIGENKITGTIPEWFGESLLSLQKLRMTGNMIHGRIPPQLCQLSNLQILHLSHNNLTGSIPSCLGTLRGLKLVKFYKWFPNYLYFSYVFTPKMELVEKGTKQTYTFTLDQVNLIDLSCNNLQGEIPNEIIALSALSTLNLSRNQLSGRIPEDIGSMQQLETLDLSSNHLSGPIPLSMASITSLSYLNLSHNNLHGPIPSTNQFGTFTDPSCFEGNPELCGKPLTTNCSLPRKREIEEEDDDEIRLCFFVSAGVGFVAMFLATFISLTIKKSWGYCCFHFMEEVGERIIRCCMGFMNRILSVTRN
ncbi:hypothetical protein KY284_002683 [Solanum tuberosum]|nr:hypothetical protein KY284_002683 [Solanum tuberosum]